MTQKELEALCYEWLTLLRLRDWDVRVRFADAKTVGESNLAVCEATPTRKIATIKILDPREPSPDRGRKRDIEADLVHECLHMHTAAFEPEDMNSDRGLLIEQAIDLIATALVGLKRKSQGASGNKRRRTQAKD